MDIDLLVELKQQRSKGLLTGSGYLLEACKVLQVDNPMEVDRQWLASQLGMSYTATTKQLHRLRAKGLI